MKVPSSKEYDVQWFERDSPGSHGGQGIVKFKLTKHRDVIPSESVMYWNFSSVKTPEYLTFSNTDYAFICNMYLEHDECYK